MRCSCWQLLLAGQQHCPRTRAVSLSPLLCESRRLACNARAPGIDDPYEEPEAAELVLEAVDAATGKHVTPQTSAARILEYLRAQKII